MSSILVMDGPGLTKQNGGGVRSRAILASLSQLGDVHVISVAEKTRHLDRFPTIDGVASQRVVVAKNRKRHRPILGMLFDLMPWMPSGQENDVRAAVEALVERLPGTPIVMLRYQKSWNAADLQNSKLRKRMCLWLDLDDRNDKIIHSRLQKSRSALKRGLANVVAQSAKKKLEDAARECDLTTLASESDLADLPQDLNIFELPNVVPDVDNAAAYEANTEECTLLFVGAYTWRPNVDGISWFLDECWPKISTQAPHAKLNIVGTGNQKKKELLEKKYAHLSGVTWHYGVPSLDAFYLNSRAVISPVRTGSGSKIKVIEAAAHNRPVVVTDHSARGLSPQFQSHLCIANTAADFASSCLEYLDDQAKAISDGNGLLSAQKTDHSIASFSGTLLRALSEACPELPFTQQTVSNYSLTPKLTEVRS